ncbi:di/tri peptide transporter 2, partial [Patellaria atrata CBS 101060]
DPKTDQKLRRVSDILPWSTFLIATVELCERFAYYGLSGPFQNYIANSYHDPNGLPGAIGLDQSGATALTNFFQFWCYVTPILGAIVADQYLGKYRTIVIFSIVYATGVFILFLTSLPWSVEHGYALTGLVVAMIVIGLGTGGIKSNVSPLIAEQYKATGPFVKTLRTGERVIVDPDLTVQRIYMVFYMCINIGSLAPVATTLLERNVGFWSAFLVPLIVFLAGFSVLVGGRKKYIVSPPTGSIITHCFKALWIACKNGGNLTAAKPSYQAQNGRKEKTPWEDKFIDELRRAVQACKVFAFYPIYWVCFNQMLNNFISQAGQMELHGIPNDIMQNLDPLTVILTIPLLDRLLYPLLRSYSIPLPRPLLITLGFLLASASMLHAALLQRHIYHSPPCYTSPSSCAAALIPPSNTNPNPTYRPNSVHIALQAPAYILIGFSEIFASVTGLEYAFLHAPPQMKSLVMSLFLLTSAGGAVLGAAVAPWARDPHLVGVYGGLAAVCGGAGVVFWLCF